MKDNNHLRMGIALLSLSLIAAVMAGCAGDKAKSKPQAARGHERGWIGGEYELASRPHIFPVDLALPASLPSSNHAGLLITALSTNTPAWDAGLRESDLVVDLDHQPVTTMKAYRKVVDRSPPGTNLTATIWREGKTLDCDIVVGREKFTKNVSFGLGLPFYGGTDLGRLDLWPNPGFSLGFIIGFEPYSEYREELWSPKGNYYRALTGTNYTSNDTDWSAWLVILWSTQGRTIHSQERFTPTNSPAAAPPK
jgi:hypothetical protein